MQTLFRSGLHDEEYGPLVSQFFIRPIGYGVQMIDPKQVPYIAKHDFLASHGDWLLAQNTGKDKYGRDYANCNYYADQLHRGASYYPTSNGQLDGPVIKRYISTMRDLARFVNRDALHQAYFNAALFLDGIGADLDPGNPYRGNRFSREGAFASLGGPDLLTLVSEVASRALKQDGILAGGFLRAAGIHRCRRKQHDVWRRTQQARQQRGDGPLDGRCPLAH
ncbi:MAG: hypothetical protein PHD43_21315 [Methylococcales bacterium]|nr:hypothetical protein [Methylococcales bacterium]